MICAVHHVGWSIHGDGIVGVEVVHGDGVGRQILSRKGLKVILGLLLLWQLLMILLLLWQLRILARHKLHYSLSEIKADLFQTSNLVHYERENENESRARVSKWSVV